MRPGGKGYAPGREPLRRSGITTSPLGCLQLLYESASFDHSLSADMGMPAPA